MKARIPATDSIDALARFWTSHDVTDFEDELEEASPSPFRRPADRSVPVPLTRAERDVVRRMASARGVAGADLLHRWVREQLHRRQGGRREPACR